VSIPVGLGELAAAIARFSTTPYLLTAGAEGRPHAVSAAPVWQGTTLVCGAGRRTSSNVTAQPAVSLLWPPDEVGGYTLIVDATAVVADADIVLTPTNAVLHRAADHPGGSGGSTATSGTGCGADCVPVSLDQASHEH
jgi:hypothetical protein